jgi:glycosyltransferase involved in cell wall biosynthesis
MSGPRVLVHLVHPGNPFAVEPDGIVSVQRNFVTAAPEGFEFDYWGVGRPGVAVAAGDGDGRMRFHAVVSSASQRPKLPISVRFAAALPRRRGELRRRGGVLRFDRVESALPLLGVAIPKTLFLHTWNARDNRNPDAESRWRVAAPVYERVFDRVVRAMDLVYVLRADMREELARSRPTLASRLRPFSVPVDTETFRPLDAAEQEAERARLEQAAGVPSAARLIVFAGRIEGQKRPLAIPEVVAAVAAPHGFDVHALVVGSGSLADALRAAADQRVPGRVHVVPPVAQNELRRILGAADAFLLPSAFEGLPNVVLESLACGTPVVAARGSAGVDDLLSKPELGASASPDPSALAAAVAAVLSRPRDVAACRVAAERFGAGALNAPVYEDMERLAGRAASP